MIKIVAVILRNAIEGNASDIHIEHTGEKVKVRFRVDGILRTTIMLPPNIYSGIVARVKILSKLRLDEKRKPQDGSFSANIDGRKIDFRVSTLPAYYGEKVVMRILDSEKGVKPLDQLGLSERNLNMMREAIKKPYGLILITGPTGSGKSTTLYSMMNELIKKKQHCFSRRSRGISHARCESVANDAGDWIYFCFRTSFRSSARSGHHHGWRNS